MIEHWPPVEIARAPHEGIDILWLLLYYLASLAPLGPAEPGSFALPGPPEVAASASISPAIDEEVETPDEPEDEAHSDPGDAIRTASRPAPPILNEAPAGLVPAPSTLLPSPAPRPLAGRECPRFLSFCRLLI